MASKNWIMAATRDFRVGRYTGPFIPDVAAAIRGMRRTQMNLMVAQARHEANEAARHIGYIESRIMNRIRKEAN